MIRKKAKPRFRVQNLGFTKAVKDRWRKPRGVGNKKRRKEAWAGPSPRIGYKNAPEVRGMHPTGFLEILVSTPAELKGVTGKLVRIASATGTRKALEIEKVATAAGLRVTNPRKVVPKEPKEKKESKEEKKGVKEAKPTEAKKPEAKKPEMKFGAQDMKRTAPKPGGPQSSQLKGGSV